MHNPFGQRLLSSSACLIELKTEFELEQVIFSMQLRNRITVVRNVRIYHFSLLKARHKTQLFSVCRLRTEWQKQHSNNWEAIQLLLDSIRFVSEHLKLLEQRATTSAGKPESTLCGTAKKCRPSFFLGSLFGDRFLFRLLLDFRTDSP